MNMYFLFGVIVGIIFGLSMMAVITRGNRDEI